MFLLNIIWEVYGLLTYKEEFVNFMHQSTKYITQIMRATFNRRSPPTSKWPSGKVVGRNNTCARGRAIGSKDFPVQGC